MTKTLVDTNILIYAVERNEQSKHEAAIAVIDELSEHKDMVIGSQNLAEFSKVLLEKTNPPQKSSDIVTHIFDFISFGSVISYSEDTVVRAISISKEYGIHYFDALLVATMQENGISKIVTENTRDFKKIGWLEAVNPFKSK